MRQIEAEDRALVRCARQGDLEAFNALARRWQGRVFNYLLRTLGDRTDAMDTCQETFLKAYHGLPKLTDEERFPQWLFRIAHNEAASLRRRARPVETRDSYGTATEVAALSPTRLGDFGYSKAELSYLVEQALAALPPRQREIVLLKVHHGFRFDEIAEIFDCPVSTAKSRLYAALRVLRERLEPATKKEEVSRAIHR